MKEGFHVILNNDSPQAIKVIVTSLTARGKGVAGSTLRRIQQFFTLDGELLAEVDPCKHSLTHDQKVIPYFRRKLRDYGRRQTVYIGGY